jgi:hypothetical protein
MTTFFLLANESVPNQQQQDCRLIVQVSTLSDDDNVALHKTAEVEVKKAFDKALSFNPISSAAAAEYLQADPGSTQGSIDLPSGSLSWHLLPIIPR